MFCVFLHSHLNKHRSGGSCRVDSGWRNGETNREHTQKQAPHLIQQEKKYLTPQLDLIEHQILLLLQIPFEDCRGLFSCNKARRRDNSKAIYARLLQMKRLLLLNVLHTSLDHPEKCTVVCVVCLLEPDPTCEQWSAAIFQSFSNKDVTEQCEGFSMTH